MNDVPVLTGERTVLTEVRETDIDRVTETCQQRIFEQYMTTPWPYERHHAEEYVREFAPSGWRGEHDELVWAIRESAAGPFCGAIGLRQTNHDVGFYLHADSQGRHLMTDALRQVVQHAFGDLGWSMVVWQARVGNEASVRVARSLGFEFLGLSASLNPNLDPETYEWTAVLYKERPAGAPEAQPWPM